MRVRPLAVNGELAGFASRRGSDYQAGRQFEKVQQPGSAVQRKILYPVAADKRADLRMRSAL